MSDYTSLSKLVYNGTPKSLFISSFIYFRLISHKFFLEMEGGAVAQLVESATRGDEVPV